MQLGRRDLNILLAILVISLGGVAAWIYRLPHLVLYSIENKIADNMEFSQAHKDSAMPMEAADTAQPAAETPDMIISSLAVSEPEPPASPAAASTGAPSGIRFREANLKGMVAGHPFSAEARKVIEGNLDETDSLSRTQILNYCEHLRRSYTSKDIDFLRQVYSDDALIVVGHVVKKDSRNNAKIGYGDKVSYSIHTKKSYLERIARIFASNKAIRIAFSDFKILRHPTVRGIYGVTLRQKYKSDNYSDDGYLFLLWDFRNPSLPQIHVRTWQPKGSISSEEDLVDISDFNLE